VVSGAGIDAPEEVTCAVVPDFTPEPVEQADNEMQARQASNQIR
jgi:hypothetical protein